MDGFGGAPDGPLAAGGNDPNGFGAKDAAGAFSGAGGGKEEKGFGLGNPVPAWGAVGKAEPGAGVDAWPLMLNPWVLDGLVMI